MCPLSTKDLHRIFQKLDRDGDGELSLEELNWLLERTGVRTSPEELEQSVGRSSLNFDEFLAFCDCITKQGEEEEEEEGTRERPVQEAEGEAPTRCRMESDLVKAFMVFDCNGDGFISSEELQEVLSRLGLWDDESGRDCRSMIRAFDTNADGVLDFEEFKNMLLHTGS